MEKGNPWPFLVILLYTCPIYRPGRKHKYCLNGQCELGGAINNQTPRNIAAARKAFSYAKYQGINPKTAQKAGKQIFLITSKICLGLV